MKKFKLVACIAAAIGLGLGFSRADDDQPANLLPNGGFERWIEWTPPREPSDPRPTVTGKRRPADWDYEVEAYERRTNAAFPITVTIFRDEEIKHGGDFAVKIQNAAKADIGGLSLASPLPVLPNTTYKVKFWYRGQDIVPNDGDGVGVIFWVNEAPTIAMWENGTITGHDPGLKKGTFDWTPYELTFTTKPNTAVISITGQIRCAQGTVWFDDFSMVLVKAAPASP